MPAKMVGRRLADFEIERLLGKGSMASVYAARQVSLRRQVALKLIEEGLFTPGDLIKRFVREAEAMAQLEHPHIVPVHAAGAESPYYFFAMRLMTEGSLECAMAAGIRLSQALEWTYQICQALAFAHRGGVVHRDLKPSNVLLQDGAAFLADFGLAHLKDLSTITQRGCPVGTPLYMSPEQTRGEEAGPGADCFALGVILYQLVSGTHPFSPSGKKGLTRAEARTALFDRIQTARFEPLRAHDPSLPAELDAILSKALTATTGDRYPDGSALLHDLDEVRRAMRNAERIVRFQPRSWQSSSTVARDRSGTPQPDSGNSPGEPPPQTAPLQPASPAHPDPGHHGPEDAKATQHIPCPPQAAPLFCFGRYEILREIGHGGQGVVYEARDPILERIVALKVVQSGFKAGEWLKQRFWREARIAARLNHPHIIPIYDFGIEQQSPYLTMPLIDGPSLDRIQEGEHRVPLPYALQVLIQTADALAFAHAQGIVHLDVKPANILVRRGIPSSRTQADPSSPFAFSPFVILTDFTMAEMVQALHRNRNWSAPPAGAVAPDTSSWEPPAAGTFAYAAPEQLDPESGVPGPRSDVFSLGVVFHEMLTGRRLFARNDRAVTRLLVLRGEVAPPSTLIPSLPPALDEFCLKLLRPHPEQRIASALEVLHAAQDLLEACRSSL